MTDVFLKIIEEFADGFLILDQQRRVIFFNDVLQRDTGLRSQEIFAREDAFLGELGVRDGQCGPRVVDITDGSATVRRFTVTCLAFDSGNGEYLLVRVKPVEREAARPTIAGWEQLFNTIGDPMFSADLSGRIIVANPSFHRLVGYDPAEALPNLTELYLNAAELEDKLLRLAETENVFNLETHLASRDRQIRRVLDTSWITRDETGVVTGYTAHLKDVTYVKNLEARLKISERNYVWLFDTIPSAITIVDPLGRILNCNYSAEKLYGWHWQELAGREFDEVFRAHRKAPLLADSLKAAAAGSGQHVETDVPRRCKDGTVRFTYATYTPLVSSEGETVAWSIMERDLTDRVRLEKKLQESFEQIKNTQRASILGLATLTEYRTAETGTHLKRMMQFTRVLASWLAKLPKYADYITPEYIEDLCLSSVLHDVGKVSIRDAILSKAGKLSSEEFEHIKTHAALGGDALRSIDKEITFQSFLTLGKEIAYYHHERWDGTGYPTGRRADQIPLSARIVALPDVYDALTSKRSYKDAISHEEAVRIISAERGTHFDPDVVDGFLDEQETFRRIRMFENFQEHPESIDDLIASGPGRRGLRGTSQVPGLIDIAQIQKAALAGIPLGFRLTGLPHEAHGLLDRILETWLGELGQERLQEPLSYCLKELIVNAWKANAKRIYFEEKGLDIRSDTDYELGMKDFRRESAEHLGLYLERLKERGIGIAVSFHARAGQLAITVRNGVEMTPREQARVFDRVARARAYSSFFEALAAPIDTTEGAGLGILMLLQFLKRVGCGEEAFSIDVEDGETVASIVLPMAKVHLDQLKVLTEALVRDVDALPHFPENVLELIRLTSDANITLAAIAGKISTDPALTADVLKLVNSAFYMLPARVNNILQAVKVVGMKGLRNLLYSYGSQKVLGERYDDMRELWGHSYRTAYYAFLLTRHFQKKNELLDDVYVTGILHDLGRIIVSYLHPDMIERMQRFCASKGIPASVLEKFSFGLNHAEIGSLLARKWNFPDQLAEGIALHHDPLRASQPMKDIVYSVYLANAMCDYERGLLVFDQLERPVLGDFGLKTEEQFKALVEKARKSFDDRKSRV